MLNNFLSIDLSINQLIVAVSSVSLGNNVCSAGKKK